MKRKCQYCGKEFEKYNKSKTGRNSRSKNTYKRPFSAVTCSPRCSKMYNRLNSSKTKNKRGTKLFGGKRLIWVKGIHAGILRFARVIAAQIEDRSIVVNV